MNLPKQAAILVGGKGTRLGALTQNAPKPLMPLDGGTVFLDEVIFTIARHGFTEILLLAGQYHEQVWNRYHDRRRWGARLQVVAETVPSGTAGALRNAADLLDETFLLTNGDTLFDFNIRRLDGPLARAPDAVAAIAMRSVPDASRFGSVEMKGNHVVAFAEKRVSAYGSSSLINGGVGLFRRSVLSEIHDLPCSMEIDVYPKLAAAGRLLGEEFSGYFIDIGLPETLVRARKELPLRRLRPAIFFDRDGVLNRDEGYTHRPESLRWIDGAITAIRRANDLGVLVFVVTNQAGVAHGRYSVTDVDLFHAQMTRELLLAGAHVDRFYICPYHPEAAVAAYRHPDPPDRKPNPGMIQNAIAEWPVDVSRSVLIGDRESDVEAARRAGIPGLLFAGGRLDQVAEEAFSMLQFTHQYESKILPPLDETVSRGTAQTPYSK